MIICADDFGLSAAVNEGILELAQKNKLSAVSCMVNFPDTYDQFTDLINLKDTLNIGLHLNLSSGNFLSLTDKSFSPPGKTLLKASLSSRYRQLLKKEVKFQYDCFFSIFGFHPTHIDAHHHTQQYPYIREVMAQVLEEVGHCLHIRSCEFPKRKGFLNIKSPRNLSLFMKSLSINFFSGGAKSCYARYGLKTNNYLLGCHGKIKENNVANVFNYYLSLSESSSDILMVHPGYVDEKLLERDTLTGEREIILNFLKSHHFTEMLKSHDIKSHHLSVV